MAATGERTEAPTPKRRREARRNGQVARSPYLAGWAGMLVGFLALPALGRSMLGHWEGLFNDTMSIAARPDQAAATQLFGSALWQAVAATLPVLGLITGVIVVTNLAQTRLSFSRKLLWRPSRLSPAAGIKRIVSPMAAWGLLRTIAELVVLGLVGWAVLHTVMDSLLGAGTLPLGVTVGVANGAMTSVIRDVAIAGLLLALVDWAKQRRSMAKQLRMTRQEVREEHRQAEGSPEIRRALRSRARKLSRRRMLAAVAQATAVVVNPTHLSVAIAYERGRDSAPRVVAKGLGVEALAIRREAQRHSIPIIENKPLAWAIHDSCDEGQMVPPQLFQAVAKLLAFVYNLSPAARSLVAVHAM